MSKKDFSKSKDTPVKTLSFTNEDVPAIQTEIKASTKNKVKKAEGEYNNVKLIIYMSANLARDFKVVAEKLNDNEFSTVKLSDIGRKALQEFVDKYK